MSVETLAVVASAQTVATTHQQAQRVITATTQAAVLAYWEAVEFARLWDTWLPKVRKATLALAAGQKLAASTAPDYVRESLALTVDEGERFSLKPSAFAGLTSDGRTIEGLLSQAPIAVLRAQAAGLSEGRAMNAGSRFLRSAVATQVVDAQDLADQVSLVAALVPAQGTPYRSKRRNPTTVGWVRVLNPPSCGRCAVLAGQFYKWNQGFSRHLNCWPAGTVVSGPEVKASAKRWYQGRLVTIRTMRGRQLSVTENHPILTLRGWIPARLLTAEDHVLTSTKASGAVPVDSRGTAQPMETIEEVYRDISENTAWKSLSVVDKHSFHGDYGQPGKARFLAEVAQRELVSPKPRKSWVAPQWPDVDAVGAAHLVANLDGQTINDRVVGVDIEEWQGFVYSLTTAEGWVCSDGIIAANCDCVHLPAPESIAGEVETDPQKYFDSLSEADQAKYFGKKNAEAIRAGANIGQVVRGSGRQGALYTVGGRRYTKEGTGKRAIYGKRAASTGFKEKRLTPFQIMKDADGNINEARRLLFRYGYIL